MFMLVVRNEQKRAALSTSKEGEGEFAKSYEGISNRKIHHNGIVDALICCMLLHARSLITSHHIKAVRQMIRYLDALN
jgi:hypothetical protein